MEDTMIFWIAMGAFFIGAFVLFSLVNIHLSRVNAMLHPENCERREGVLKEKSVKTVLRNGWLQCLLCYKYTYRINGGEHEIGGEKRYSTEEKAEAEGESLPETIEVLYNEKYPKRAYSQDIKTDYNPRQDKIFKVMLDVARVCCPVGLAYCIYELIKLAI